MKTSSTDEASENDLEEESRATDNSSPRPLTRSLIDVFRLIALDQDLGGLTTYAVSAASVLGGILAVVGAPVWLPLAIWALCLVGWVLQVNLTRLHDPERLGAHLISRVAAVLGSLALTISRDTGDSISIITLALLALAILSEPPLRRMETYVVQGAKGLQGAEIRPEDPMPVGLLYPTSVAATTAAVVSATTGLAWIVTQFLIAAVLVLAALSLVSTLRSLASAESQRAAISAAVRRYAPTFALYWRADPGTDYQISMWLPYLERLGTPFVVIVRTLANFEEATALTGRPVLLRRRMPELDDVVVPSLRTVFYVNNAAVNSHMVRFPGLTHIMLNHGDSDKAPSFNPVSRMFDHNFVAGQAAIDRFANNQVVVPEGQLVIVGRPQIEDIAPARAPINELQRPSVLYAPTWEGFTGDAQYSSLRSGLALVHGLLERGCNVIFRPHPYTYRTPQFVTACRDICAALAADPSPDADHRFGAAAETDLSIIDCFNLSDAMISDVSSVASDYLQSSKPLAMTVVHTTMKHFVEEFPIARAAYLLTVADDELPNLDELLRLLLDEDPQRDVRRSLKTYYLGDPGDGPYVDLFLRQAERFV